MLKLNKYNVGSILNFLFFGNIANFYIYFFKYILFTKSNLKNVKLKANYGVIRHILYMYNTGKMNDEVFSQPALNGKKAPRLSY